MSLIPAFWNKIGLSLGLMVFIGISLCGADQSEYLNDLVQGKKISEREQQRIVQSLKGQERLLYQVLTAERRGMAPVQLEVLIKQLENRREQAAKIPAAICAMAIILIIDDQISRADELIKLLPSVKSALLVADTSCVNAYAAFQRGKLQQAVTSIRSSRYALKRAVPEASYANWHSRLISARLQKLEVRLRERQDINTGGEAFAAWLQADAKRKKEAYEHIITSWPDSIYASASRLILSQRLLSNDLKACEAFMQEAKEEFDGPLADQFHMLAGDLQVLGGNLREAQKHYSSALRACSHSKNKELDSLPPSVKQRLIPVEPLHRKDKWNYPIWEGRPNGCILASALDEQNAALHRYRIIVRQATLYYLAGRYSAAGHLAHNLVTIDPVDRIMAKEKDGAGGKVLAHTLSKKFFLFPLQVFEKLPDAVRASLMLGVSFYQVYDWNNAEVWTRRGLEMLTQKHAQAHNAAHTLLACIAQMRKDYKRALACAAKVQLEPGERAHDAWFVARQVEWEIYQHTPEDYAGAMSVFTQIQRQAPGTSYAELALLYQAIYAYGHDQKLSKSLFLKYKKRYPSTNTEAVSFHLNSINKMLELNESE